MSKSTIASGTAAPDATEFEVTAAAGTETYGILSSSFLYSAFRTLSFRIKVTVHPDDTWSYEEDTVLQLPDRDAPFHHIDRNTFVRVAEPAPNPLVAAAPAARTPGSLDIGSLRDERGNLR